MSFLACCAWFIEAPILAARSWYWSHDMIRYPYLASQFKEVFDNGFLYPRWIPDLMAGYGYPTFVYYQPGFFFFSLPFSHFFSSITYALKVQIFVLLMIGGGGAYLLARELIRSLPYRLLATYFYMITPYLSTNLNFRGALAEFQAMLLCPLLLWVMLRYAKAFIGQQKLKRWLISFSLLTAAIIYSHPFVALYLFPCLGIIALFLWPQTNYSLKYLLYLLLGVFNGIVLSAPYWHTVISMYDEVSWGISDFMTGRAKGFTQYFYSFFNPGKVHIALALLGFFLGRKTPFILASFMCFALLTFMMTTYSNFIWNLNTPLNRTQFAWRINSVHALFQFIGIASAICALDRSTNKTKLQLDVLGLVLIVTVGATAYTVYRPNVLSGQIAWPKDGARRVEYRPFANIPFHRDRNNARKQGWETATATGEFRPVHVRNKKLLHRNRLDIPVAEVFPQHAGRITLLPASTPSRIRFQFEFQQSDPVRDVNLNLKEVQAEKLRDAGPQRYSSALLNQFFLPGWKVIINGKPAQQSYTTREMQEIYSFGPGHGGRMRINFPFPGKHEVYAYYEGPPGWLQRNLYMILALAVSLYLTWMLRHSQIDEFASQWTHRAWRRLVRRRPR